jgi:hypothetical protein
MSEKWHLAGNWKVEIWFAVQKDSDGYPRHKNWEQLLGRPMAEDDSVFQIESIPFFLKNVSRGDIVRARGVENLEIQEGEIFEFESVLERGGHNTYRLLIRQTDPNDPDHTINELLGKGLAVEDQDGRFLAVDVPPSVDQAAIDRYLVEESEKGRWEMQDGYLHTIKTHL